MSELFEKALRRKWGIAAYHMHEQWERGTGTQLTPDNEITDEMAKDALYRDLFSPVGYADAGFLEASGE